MHSSIWRENRSIPNIEPFKITYQVEVMWQLSKTTPELFMQKPIDTLRKLNVTLIFLNIDLKVYFVIRQIWSSKAFSPMAT